MEKLNGTLKPSGNLTGEEIPVIIKEKTVVEKDYENLDNKPSINGTVLDGNKTPEELGLTKASDFELYKQSVDHSFRGVSESIRSVKTESKTYTDNAIEATKEYSDGKNADLETAINEKINNKNNATRAYASHLVSEERGARETADEETLTASKSYTDTAVVKEITKGPASSLEFEGLQEGIPFPKIILTVPDEYVYEEGKTAHSINIWCNNYSDPDATEQYSENMLVVAKSNTVEIGYDDTIKLLKQVPGKCVVGFSNEEDAAVCTLTVTGALKYEALKRIYSECWNRMDVEKDNMEGYVRGYTDTEITKCKEYTDEKIKEVGDITSKGNPVQLDGLQGGVPFSEMVVSGKNLVKYPFVGQRVQAEGITMVDNGDGSVTVNGRCDTIDATFYIHPITLLPNTDYVLSGCPAGGSTDGYRIQFADNSWNTVFVDRGNGAIIRVDEKMTFQQFRIIIAKGTLCDNLVFRPQLELGSTPTEYEPPITGQNITMWACKKNLIPHPYNRASGTYNGIKLIVHDDGRFDMSGIATASFAILVFADRRNPIYLSGGQTYTISCNTPYDFSKFNLSARIYHTDGTYTGITKFPTTFVAQEREYLTSSLWINSDVSVSAKNVELQLELGDTATDYEPYHGASYTVTPDSNPYVIPNDIRQQEGYNVISVSAGELSVSGVRKNAALKRVWKEMNDFNTKIGNINTILESVTGGVE